MRGSPGNIKILFCDIHEHKHNAHMPTVILLSANET